MTGTSQTVRCAIYTRVSTDSGLDQEFNSLDAQHDAASAYIRSQAHAHWTLFRTRYDDGGFSGGSTDRPALQRLLADVRARRINVIVVYKVDRLTRSLADFAKLVELFDAHGVSFVSVTQQFNTTTSMGRLTLNVLLSFAQFEREVTSERIRDKVAASKRKGLWVGGMVPMGYELKDGKLLIVEEEAEQVRTIFQRYLEVGSVNQLIPELEERGFRTKLRRLSTGASRGGVPFRQGMLFQMLRNPFYVGDVRFKGEICPGPQPPLLDRPLFDAVQARLTEQWQHRTRSRIPTDKLLSGRIYDDAGYPMIPNYSIRGHVRYWYYVSEPRLRGQTKVPAGSEPRVPANDIEAIVIKTLKRHLAQAIIAVSHTNDRELISAYIERIVVSKREITIHLKRSDHSSINDGDHLRSECRSDDIVDPVILSASWSKPRGKKFRELLLPPSTRRETTRPIKAERKAALLRAIARGRTWLDEVVSGADVADIATRHKCSIRHVQMTISMAFTAPALVQATLDGRLPRGIGVARLRDAPAEWSQQFTRLGLTPPAQ